MSFSDWWITAIIRCSSLAYASKTRFVKARGLSALYEGCLCVIFEILVWIVALPLLVSTTRRVVDEGKKAEFRYRRLTIILVFLVLSSIWLVKGTLVLVREFILQQGDHFTLHAIHTLPAQEMWEKKSTVSGTLLFPPRILGIHESGSVITVYGDSVAQSRVAVFMDDVINHRTAVLRTDASAYGSWSVSTRNEQNESRRPLYGRYSVSAVAELPESQLRSMPSSAVAFNISQPWSGKMLVFIEYAVKIVVIILLVSAFIVSF